jgi:CheY-like chemotaxis protein
MKNARVLLVEDSELWQAILQTHISMALPDSGPPAVASTFQEGDRALRQGGWDLVVTDIGLPPDAGHVLGMQLVSRAKEAEVPCIVVSGTEAVTKQLVRDLLVGEDYRARDFFSKEELRASPAMQRRFQELIRAIAAAAEAARSGPPGVEDPGPETTTPAAGEGGAAPPGPLGVTIGIRDACLYLGAEGRENLPIPKGPAERVFLFFARNVSTGLPAKVVENRVLNAAVGAGAGDSADPFLRKAVNQLNDRLRRWAGLPADRRWIVKGSGEHGYCLNTTDIRWDLTKELRGGLRDDESIYYLLADPRKLQQNTPDRGQDLPARPRRMSDVDDDEG